MSEEKTKAIKDMPCTCVCKNEALAAQKRIRELEKQIREMRSCFNCKHSGKGPSIHPCSDCASASNGSEDRWEWEGN